MFCDNHEERQGVKFWADLCPDFENILEAHASVSKLALQQHDDVVVVLLNLLLCAGF